MDAPFDFGYSGNLCLPTDMVMMIMSCNENKVLFKKGISKYTYSIYIQSYWYM